MATRVWDQPIPEHPAHGKLFNGFGYDSCDVHKHGLYEAESIAALATFNQRNLVWQALSNVGLAEYLHLDHRPTFVIDLTTPKQDRPKKLAPVYLNPAILHDSAIFDQVHGKFFNFDAGMSPWRAYADFQKWVYGDAAPQAASMSSSFLFKGYIWSAVTVEDKWRVVSGTSYNDLYNGEDDRLKRRRGSVASTGSRDRQLTQVRSATEQSSKASTPDPFQARKNGSNKPVTEQCHSLPPAPEGSFDWTQQTLDELSDHLRLVRNVDWASTALGAIETWSPQLRLAMNMVMADPCPAVLLWGEDCTMVYNELYAPMIEAYHPWCLGTSVFDSLKEYNDQLIPVINAVRQSGQAIYQKDLPLFVPRNGMLEEAWFTITYHPLLGANGQVEGVFEQIRETTRIRITERRLLTFLELGARMSTARHLGDFWDLAMVALQKNERDVPFALLYSIKDKDEDSSGNRTSLCSKNKMYGKRAILQGSVGVPEGHKCAPVSLCLEGSNAGFMPWFRKSIKTRKMVVLNADEGTLPAGLLDGIENRAFGEPCRTVAIAPIMPTGSDNVLGFYVAGINPRRPFDEGYEKFVHASSLLLATSLASVVLLEEEVDRRKTIVEESAQAQAELSQQLLAKQQRIEMQERRFQRIAERADIGLFVVSPTGEYRYRNEQWFDIFRIAKDADTIECVWEKVVDGEGISICEKHWQKLTVKAEPVSFELKLTRKWNPGVEHEDSTVNEEDRKLWVIISAYPELNEDGTVKEIIGLVMDISQQKWAERVQKQRAQDALESKRALENFIDTTSHEIRNPLSAITQTADALLTSALNIVSTYSSAEAIPKERKELLQVVIESAQTIIQCSSHQKRIVDDVLTMSKLDSNLLTIFPIDSQPEHEIRYALKIFEGEAKEAKINVEFKVDKSYTDLNVDWVMLNPTRLNQVFVNLLTNSIKFTRLEKNRSITVIVGATDKPPQIVHGVRFIETTSGPTDPTFKPMWGEGEPIYITVSVQDSGRGLTLEEQELLFMRFSQASPKTHVYYGGNGLGLYISRRLAEMQGGGIGFASTFGRGSTFSFFVKGRRSLNNDQRSRLPALGEIDINNAETLAKIPALLRRSSSNSDTDSDLPTPLATAATRLIPNGVQQQEDADRGSAAPQAPEIIHVLIVEDNLVNQKVLARQLRTLGCIVDVANHGLEALSHLEKTPFWRRQHQHHTQQHQPEITLSNATTTTTTAQLHPLKSLSLILMDWEMPIMDGVSCVRRIRELQSSGAIAGHVPVIGVTANARLEQVQQAMGAGMDDVVTKPFRVPDLFVRMKALLEKLKTPTEPTAP